jgi:kynurenine formamidase
MLAEGKTLYLFPIEKFYGDALVIPVPDGHSFVDQTFLAPYADHIREVDFVLFHTGWSRYWGTPRYFEGFPTLTTEAMQWLTGFSLKGVGFDVISADPLLSSDYPNHLLLFHKEMIIIENLVFPPDWQISRGRLSCFPLAYEDADGSPVRAVMEV